MLRRVDIVRTDVSEKLSPSFIRVTRISKLGTTLAVTSNRRTLLSLLFARQLVGKNLTSVTNTPSSIIILIIIKGGFCVVRVVPRKVADYFSPELPLFMLFYKSGTLTQLCPKFKMLRSP
jgi:hypothetical protein